MSGRLWHTLVKASDEARPERLVLFLHGILGSGSNFRSFAKRFVTEHPAWGALLVDLRMHGQSQHLPPPHTVAAAASDVLALLPSLPQPLDAIVGHSFGGKVTLELVRAMQGDLARAVVLDATPGPRLDARGSETTVAVVELLGRLTGPFPTREAFVDRVVAEGHARPFAQWLAMNLARSEDALRLRLDLGAIRALLDDYFALDLWPVLESPPGRVRFDVVIGGRSGVFDAGDRARAERIASASGGRVAVTVLPDAGHWVHVDDPEGTFDVVRRALC